MDALRVSRASLIFLRGIMATLPLTKAGSIRLTEELQKLKTVERPAVIQAIAEARAQGDLSENAEYDAARERQGFIEARIKELEGVLSNSQIIEPSTLEAGDKIVFGATVELEDLDSGEHVKYQLVGDAEADIKLNTISISSPVARGLIGKHEGDTIKINVPSGEKEYEILSVEYI